MYIKEWSLIWTSTTSDDSILFLLIDIVVVFSVVLVGDVIRFFRS